MKTGSDLKDLVLYWPEQFNMSSEDWYWPEQLNMSSEDLY